MHHVLETLFGTDLKAGLFVILNLIVIESLLSIDNAAVLATMVSDLPKEQRERALKWGIWGAFILRGICLLTASYLVSIWWLKAVGGLYLIYLCYGHFTKANDTVEEESSRSDSAIYNFFHKHLGVFWSTVALVEVMDLAFSMDNVFAAVAFTDHIGLICTGVFIGILAMRFVAQAFVKLMEKFKFLENVAFLVIGLLGLKLTATFFTHLFPHSGFTKVMDSEHTDLFISLATVLIFAVPVLTSIFFNYPKKTVEA